MKKLRQTAARILFFLLNRWFRLIPVKKNRVLFESFLGVSFSGSPKELSLSLDKERYEILWAFRQRRAGFAFKQVKRLSPSYFFYLATAGVIVSNSRMTPLWEKRPGQKYIQTWHGTPLKRLVYDMENTELRGYTDQEKYRKTFSLDVARWDCLISSCPFTTEKFRSAFRFEGTILEVGFPANIRLHTHRHDHEYQQTIKNALGIPPEKKILLYAPTFRDHQNDGDRYHFEETLDFDRLAREFPDRLILVRYHYLVRNPAIRDLSNVIDVTDYEDINDLYLIADGMITDYSSTMFDFAILERPIYLFATDLERYRDVSRGFYLDYFKDLPCRPVQDNQSLIDLIRAGESFPMKDFNARFNPHTGEEAIQSITRVIDGVFLA